MSDSSINQALTAIISLAEQAGLFAPIKRGPMDASAGLRMELAAGSAPIVHMDGRRVARLVLSLGAKHADMQLASNTLHRIHEALTRPDVCPRTDQWQVTHIATHAMPEVIERDPGGLWLLASALTVTLYY